MVNGGGTIIPTLWVPFDPDGVYFPQPYVPTKSLLNGDANLEWIASLRRGRQFVSVALCKVLVHTPETRCADDPAAIRVTSDASNFNITWAIT